MKIEIGLLYAYGYFAILCLAFGVLIVANMLLGDRHKRM